MGEMMHIVAKNGGWWMAVKIANPTEKGWAPSNYLSIVNEVTGELEKVQVTPRTQAGQVRPETMAGTNNIPTSGRKDAAATVPASAAPVSFPDTKGKPLLYAVKALHKFSATQADGLSFDQGEILSIVGMKDGWLRAVSASGKEGWAPSNYTKQIEGSVPSAAQQQKEVKQAEGEADDEEEGSPAPRVMKSLSVDTAVGQSSAPPTQGSSASNNINNPSPSPRPDVPPLDFGMTPRVDQPTPRAPELPTDAQVAMTPRGVSSSGSGSSSGSLSGTDTPEEEYRDQVGDLLITPRMAASIGQQAEKVRAMFHFEAKKPDHLSFKKGDVMVVIKKKAGWWKCHHEGASGKIGYIPSNYVQALVPVAAGVNPTTTILTAAGGVVSIPAEFEPTKDRPLLVKASHSYKAQANNQLSFTKHDLLHVISKNKGWWKAYRCEDSEKVGYIPSNYVKVHNGGEVPKEGEGSLSSSSAASSVAATNTATAISSSNGNNNAATPAAAAPVEMEEIAIALHDLDKKDPKVLVLKRDDRFAILDKNVGGGWWRCLNLNTGEMALAPSNFLKTEMAPKRMPPPIPASRGTVPNQATVFVEGTYDFTAKKPSQLSYKKYDSLVILKKDGSWWKARNKMGKVGSIPFNYCKEVVPTQFTTLFPYSARSVDEVSFKENELFQVENQEQPGWWLISSLQDPSRRGYAPSNYLHPLSTRLPGQVSAPATPRTAAEPDVPATPRNLDGSVRVDPPVDGAAGTSAGGLATVGVGAEGPGGISEGVKVEVGSAPVRRFSGTLSSSPIASQPKDVAQVIAPTNIAKVASVVLPAVHAASPSSTPRPEFMHEKLAPSRIAPVAPQASAVLKSAPPSQQDGEGLRSSPPPSVPSPEVDAVPQRQASPPVDATPSTSNSVSAGFANAGSKLTGFFDSLLPSASAKKEDQPAVGESTPQKSMRPEPDAGLGSPPAAAASSFSGFSPAPVSSQQHQQVEGLPNQSASVPTQQPAQPVFAFYEGEGDGSAAEGSNDLPSKQAASSSNEEHKTNGVEIGGPNDTRTKSAVELNNRGACAGGWSNFFGVFAACTGANRETSGGTSSTIPKPQSDTGSTQYEEKQETK